MTEKLSQSESTTETRLNMPRTDRMEREMPIEKM